MYCVVLQTSSNAIVYSIPQGFCEGIYVTSYYVHISDRVEFVAKDLSCLTEILELLKGAILRFNNRNLNFNPLSTKIPNKNFRFIGTLRTIQIRNIQWLQILYSIAWLLFRITNIAGRFEFSSLQAFTQSQQVISKRKLCHSLCRILKNTDYAPVPLIVFCDVATIINLNSLLWLDIFEIIFTTRHSIG